MKLNFIFTLLVVLISCLVANVSANLLDKLLDLFRNSSSDSNSTSVQSQQFFTNGRSSFISENDHKFHLNSPLNSKFIIHLQDILSKKSVESIENKIVNDNPEEESNSNDDFIMVESVHTAEDHAEPDENLDEEEEDEDEEFTIKFHNKKNSVDGFRIEGPNDLKIPPRSRLAEKLLDALANVIMDQSKEARKKPIAKKAIQLNDTIADLNQTESIKFNQTETMKLNRSEPIDLNQSEPINLNQSELINLNQSEPIKLNQTETMKLNRSEPINLNQSESINLNQSEPIKLNETKPINLNQANYLLKIKSFHKFDNSTNTTSYTYLAEHHALNSNLTPKMMPSKLLGNTLDSIEKIFGKYTFLNLYAAPTVNDTHNDRDLLEKDGSIVIKANFVDDPRYASVEKSPIVGEAPVIQNLTDFTFGIPHIKNDESNSKPNE